MKGTASMKRTIAFALIIMLGGCSSQATPEESRPHPTSTPAPWMIRSADQLPSLMPRPTALPLIVGNAPIQSVCLEFDYQLLGASSEEKQMASMIEQELMAEDLTGPYRVLLSAADIEVVEEDCQGTLLVQVAYDPWTARYGEGVGSTTCVYGHDMQGEFQLKAAGDSLHYPFEDHLHRERPEMILKKDCGKGGMDIHAFLLSEFPRAMADWYGPEAYFYCVTFPYSVGWDVFDTCEEDLRQLEADAALPAAQGLLERGSYLVRLSVIEFIDRLRMFEPETTDRVIPLLLTTLSGDEDGEVRFQAGEVLKSIAGEDFPGPTVYQWRPRANGEIEWETYQIQDPQAWADWWDSQ